MNYKDNIEWLKSLKQQIGQTQHRDLWHFEQVIDETIDNLRPLAILHGRLIDCESDFFPTAFRHNLTDYAKGWNTCLRSVLLSPTIIEAEVSE